MAETTKRALAESCKKLVATKPLDKVTVTDITQDCGVNRQTFYYHFRDIYDLVEWIFLTESTQVVGTKRTYETWQQGFLRVFAYVRENADFVTRIYHSISREYLERFLYSETYKLLIDVVEELSEGMTVRDDDKAFIANFYKYGFTGLLLEWISEGMVEDPERIIDRLGILIQGDMTKALEKFRLDRPTLR